MSHQQRYRRRLTTRKRIPVLDPELWARGSIAYLKFALERDERVRVQIKKFMDGFEAHMKQERRPNDGTIQNH